MKAGTWFAAAALASVFLNATPGALAEPPLAYVELKQRIALSTLPDGARVASSSPVAQSDKKVRADNGGRGSIVAFAYAEKREGAPAIVSIVTHRQAAIFPTEVQTAEKIPKDSDKAFLSPDWREVRYTVLEWKAVCDKSWGQWCAHTMTRRVMLSSDDVRMLLASRSKTILVGVDYPRAEYSVPREHLRATLDALGVLQEFG